jgi:hypothetical protein
MGVWSTAVTSWNASGTHSGMLPYSPKGPSSHFPFGASPPREGLLHNMKRGVLEMAGVDNAGAGMVLNGAGKQVRYGGGIFSGGGWREILHDVHPSTGKMFAMGARRTGLKTLGKFAGKAVFPAMFAYQAATEGVGAAVRDNVVSGAIFGAARWGLTRLGMGLFNPFTIGAAALVGGVIGGRQALIAGRDYGTSLRSASFGEAFKDTNGTAATMRQASLSAIQNSKINGRNALGAEANYLHM